MRPTQLNFKSPQERTAEFKTFAINKTGGNMNFLQKTLNQSGSILPKEPRFKDKPLYDKGTGQTCFLGPGSYNDHQSFIDLNKSSCPSKIVSPRAYHLLPHQSISLGLDANHSFASERVRPAVLHHDRRPDQV